MTEDRSFKADLEELIASPEFLLQMTQTEQRLLAAGVPQEHMSSVLAVVQAVCIQTYIYAALERVRGVLDGLKDAAGILHRVADEGPLGASPSRLRALAAAMERASVMTQAEAEIAGMATELGIELPKL